VPTNNAIPLQYKSKELNELFIRGKTPGGDNSPNKTFIDDFTQWIIDSERNKISGLDKFKHATFVHGTVQAFDHFYLRHRDKHFKVLPGEFAYHKAALKHNGFKISTAIQPLDIGDAVILSCPSSLSGSHGSYNWVLPECEEKGIPVLVDMAWLPVAKNMNINLKYECIDTVCCSISKAFPGAPNLRVGVRWQREYHDDGIDLANEQQMLPWININIANRLINRWKLDDNWNRFEGLYNDVILKYRLTKTNSIIIGLGDSNWRDYHRSSNINRVCISNELGQMINDSNAPKFTAFVG
jgi:hypothetical protein